MGASFDASLSAALRELDRRVQTSAESTSKRASEVRSSAGRTQPVGEFGAVRRHGPHGHLLRLGDLHLRLVVRGRRGLGGDPRGLDGGLGDGVLALGLHPPDDVVAGVARRLDGLLRRRGVLRAHPRDELPVRRVGEAPRGDARPEREERVVLLDVRELLDEALLAVARLGLGAPQLVRPALLILGDLDGRAHVRACAKTNHWFGWS